MNGKYIYSTTVNDLKREMAEPFKIHIILGNGWANKPARISQNLKSVGISITKSQVVRDQV